MNGKELNTIIQKSITADLNRGKNKRTQVVSTYIDKSINEDEAFAIDCINIADS